MPSKSMVEDGDYWRSRAAESRARAEMMVDAAIRETLSGVAEQYDRLAERADRYAARARKVYNGTSGG